MNKQIISTFRGSNTVLIESQSGNSTQFIDIDLKINDKTLRRSDFRVTKTPLYEKQFLAVGKIQNFVCQKNWNSLTKFLINAHQFGQNVILF